MVFLLENLSGPGDIRHTGDHRLGNIVLRIFATTVKLGSTTLANSHSAAWPATERKTVNLAGIHVDTNMRYRRC